jgi:hypothetical protein
LTPDLVGSPHLKNHNRSSEDFVVKQNTRIRIINYKFTPHLLYQGSKGFAYNVEDQTMRLCHLATAIIFSLPLTFADEIIESLLDQPADGQGSSGSNQTLQPVESLSTPAPVPATTAVPSQQQDETTSAGAGNCDQHADSHSKHKFNPFIHKPVYNVQVHATRGLDEAYDDVYKVFGEYLTMTAGQMFDPPISFQVVPQYFDGLFDAIKNEEMDFLYANPGVYSCVGVEAGATSLVTVVKDLDVRFDKENRYYCTNDRDLLCFVTMLLSLTRGSK